MKKYRKGPALNIYTALEKIDQDLPAHLLSFLDAVSFPHAPLVFSWCFGHYTITY